MIEVILCDRLLCGVESDKETKRLSTTMRRRYDNRTKKEYAK